MAAPQVYVAGGKLGDLLHVMYVVKATHERTGAKGVVLVTDDPTFGGDVFSHGLRASVEELRELMGAQPYIERFDALASREELADRPVINLNAWRSNLMDWKWFNFLPATYGLHPVDPSPWLALPRGGGASDVLIHYSTSRPPHPAFSWDAFVDAVGAHRCAVVTSVRAEYDAFPCRDRVPLRLAPTLGEVAAAIEACAFFVGCQSSPIVFAIASGKPCLCLLDPGAAHMYKGLPCPHLRWYESPGSMSLDGLAAHLGPRAQACLEGRPPPSASVALPVSVGEAVDKLSVLRIKRRRLADPAKLAHVQAEICAIEPLVEPHAAACRPLCVLLEAVNTLLWDLVDRERAEGVPPQALMRENDARFRLKKKINRATGSAFCEQKSFGELSDVVRVGGDPEAMARYVAYRSAYVDALEVLCPPKAYVALAGRFAHDPSVRVLPMPHHTVAQEMDVPAPWAAAYADACDA